MKSQSENNNDLESARYRFEMVEYAAKELYTFSRKIKSSTPFVLPKDLPSVRGWIIRFEGLPEYISVIEESSLIHLKEKIDKSLILLQKHISRWEQHITNIDPLLRPFEIMPGDENALENISILNDRAYFAAKLITQELCIRHKD
ncbi:MAG: hypothetical protein JW709_07255 [Sedimentisphaerales bacterium]|nr:hypothetical protein [Sedimentisphaerales bacterium]